MSNDVESEVLGPIREVAELPISDLPAYIRARAEQIAHSATWPTKRSVELAHAVLRVLDGELKPDPVKEVAFVVERARRAQLEASRARRELYAMARSDVDTVRALCDAEAAANLALDALLTQFEPIIDLPGDRP
jgi:hypothetical protein